MAYTPYYTNGWQDGSSGGTPITAEALNHMESGVEDNATNAGELSNLTTTDKSNLVAAINEVDADVDTLNSKIAYSAGTYTVSAQCFGFITTASTFAALNFVIPKIILPGLSITVTSITGAAIRCGGSYLVSNGATLTSYIGNVSANGQIVYVPLSKSDGFGVSNNYALAGLATVTFTLS